MPSKYPAHGRGSRPRKCRECGALRADGADISFRGLCADCGRTKASDAIDQLHDGAGPHYEQWRIGMIDFLRTLVDD